MMRFSSGNAVAAVPAGRNAAGGDVVFGVAVRGRTARLPSPAAPVDRRGPMRRRQTPRRAWRSVRPEDLRIDLSRAIQSLPGHYREVILLRDIEELSIDEIDERTRSLW